jgi:exonuclease VII small subunit
MNKTRRAALNALQDRLTANKAAFEATIAELREIKDDLETIRDEEQDSFDNLPEGLQAGEKGQDMEAAISSIEDAMNTLDNLPDAIDLDEIDAAFSSIDDAKGAA